MDGEVTFFVDDEKERVTGVYRGTVTDAMMNAAVADLLAKHPQIIRYDSLTDMRESLDVFTPAGIDDVAEIWATAARHADRDNRTAMVVRSARSKTWIWSLAIKFPNREFQMFTTREDAERWLDEALARRRASEAG